MDSHLLLHDLAPDPRDEWVRLLAFVGWTDTDRRVAGPSVEALLAHSRELVHATYDHLMRVPETAAILGSSARGATGSSATAEHLAERRAFLSVWLARTLGLDTSDEFALYLFRAGQMHAGLGPRRVDVPRSYLIGTVGLVLSAFSSYLVQDGLPASVVGSALGVWSRYLSVQLELMLMGYESARSLTAGPVAIRCAAYGRIRTLIGARELSLGVSRESRVRDVLRSLFAAYPAVRAEALDRVWDERPGSDGTLTSDGTIVPTYAPRAGWRLLLNGRDVRYGGGLMLPISHGDEVAIFPPGR